LFDLPGMLAERRCIVALRHSGFCRRSLDNGQSETAAAPNIAEQPFGATALAIWRELNR
jgi:hypothetical protein